MREDLSYGLMPMTGASSFLRGIPQEDVQSEEERGNAHVYFSDVPTIVVSQPMCPPKPEQVERAPALHHHQSNIYWHTYLWNQRHFHSGTNSTQMCGTGKCQVRQYMLQGKLWDVPDLMFQICTQDCFSYTGICLWVVELISFFCIFIYWSLICQHLI